MPRTSTKGIGTWPTPEKPLSIDIPAKLLAEFKEQPRFVLRHPWIVGIPVPWKMLVNEDFANKIKEAGLEVMLVPREQARR